jgi:hypothetical protein
MKGHAVESKYLKQIKESTLHGLAINIDVYDVLKAFSVTCPAIQHAVKKLLCAGQRGGKDRETDLQEACESIFRAIQLCEAEGNGKQK